MSALYCFGVIISYVHSLSTVRSNWRNFENQLWNNCILDLSWDLRVFVPFQNTRKLVWQYDAKFLSFLELLFTPYFVLVSLLVMHQNLLQFWFVPRNHIILGFGLLCIGKKTLIIVMPKIASSKNLNRIHNFSCSNYIPLTIKKW